MMASVILWLLLVFALLVLFVISSSFIGFLMTRVPFVRSSAGDIRIIVNKLQLGKSDVFYDLGSGDGQVIFLVEKLSGAKVTGFELTWWTHLLAKLKRMVKHSHAVLENKNFFHRSWSEATVIYGYLYPPLMGRVEEKFRAECKPGSRAVIRDFPFPTMKPVEILYTGNKKPRSEKSTYQDTKMNRFKILLKSLVKFGNISGHEIYVYQL